MSLPRGCGGYCGSKERNWTACMKKDYYLILRLTPEATAEEIRSAYRRLAIELHPDLSGLDSDPFLELQEAYSVLSDPTRRAVYDREAQEVPIRRTDVARRAGIVIRRRHSAEPFAPVQSVGGFEEISLLQSFETFHPSVREMFDRLWSNFELVTRPKAERLENLTVDVPLSPRQAFAGGQMCILVPAREICPACSGTGSVGPYQCWRCEGHGALMDELSGDGELSRRVATGLCSALIP
jgi:molecular chaperone DnaJ